MTRIGCSITKRVTFRDSTQEFSNVYHYEAGIITDAATLGENVVDALVAIEKPRHGSDVSFIQGRVWTTGGTKAENEMVFQKPLTGTGTSGLSTSMDRERAYLIQWPAGTDSRGHPVTLKKWYHLNAQFNGAAVTASIVNQQTGFTDTQRGTIQAEFSDVDPLVIAGGGVLQLVSNKGRGTDSGPVAHKYLEHHQLGDQWRG